MQMQTDPKPNTKPIAQWVRRQKTNLGNKTDQLKIHKAVYQDHLENTLSFEPKLVSKLLKLYDSLIEAEQMNTLFQLRIETFHSAFIQKLQSL